MTPTSQFAQHPDPEHLDLESLNAFIENALPALERESVLVHLASCRRCRQIAYLAQSAVEEEAAIEPAPQPIPPTRNRFGQWLAGFQPGNRRLVILAGACAAIAAFTIVSLPKHTVAPLPQQEAKIAPPPIPASNATSSLTPKPDQLKQKSADTGAAAARPLSPVVSRSQVGQGAPAFPVHPTPSFSRHESLGSITGRSYESAALPAPQPTPSTPIGSASETVEVSAAPSPLQPAPQPQLQQTISSAQIVTMDANAANSVAPPATKPAPARPATLGGQGFGRGVGGVVSRKSAIAAPLGANTAIGTPQAAPVIGLYSRAAGFNDELLAGKAMQTLLPTGSHPTATAAVRQRVLAIDPSGALYLSQNAGVLWLPIPQQWTGRATRLRIFTPQPADARSSTGVDKTTPSAGNVPARDTSDPRPLFELTTDQGALWFSEDGNTWKPNEKP